MSEHSQWGKMKRNHRSVIATAWMCLLLLLGATAGRAQQAANDLRAGYDPGRETNLVGTVSSFTANSETGPLGAHLAIQTPGGVVDVHVGSAKFLELNHLTLNSGDNVRIIGENFTNGGNTVFLARIIQKGTVAVAVRSPRGIPLWLGGARALQAPSQAQKSRGGAQ
jgi:hypothetical protein